VPNLTYMAVQWGYLLALAIWLGGMIAFTVLFAPSLSAVLARADAGRVVGVFLGRFRVAVTVCIVLLVATSAVKFMMWETITPWLLLRWCALGGMMGLTVYDFTVLAPRLAAAKAAGDGAAFASLHKVAVATMGATMLLGMITLFVS